MSTLQTIRRSQLGISAILPAYNEGALIEQSVRTLAGVLRTLTERFEVIVVDDGSRDGTGEVLAHLRAVRPDLKLRVVTHERNRGYGAALASGFDAARLDVIFFTDGDRQFDVTELVSILPALDDATDLVIGWREYRADPLPRRLNAWLWGKLVNALFGYTARDVDCAFKLFRREVWEAVTVDSRGATFSAEFLIKARRLGFRVTERPVSHFPRTAGSATGAKPAVILRALADLLRLRARLADEVAGLAPSPPTPSPSARERGLSARDNAVSPGLIAAHRSSRPGTIPRAESPLPRLGEGAGGEGTQPGSHT